MNRISGNGLKFKVKLHGRAEAKASRDALVALGNELNGTNTTTLLSLPADIIRSIFLDAGALVPGEFVCKRLKQCLAPEMEKPARVPQSVRDIWGNDNEYYSKCWGAKSFRTTHVAALWSELGSRIPCADNQYHLPVWMPKMVSWLYDSGAPTLGSDWTRTAISFCAEDALRKSLARKKGLRFPDLGTYLDGYLVFPAIMADQKGLLRVLSEETKFFSKASLMHLMKDAEITECQKVMNWVQSRRANPRWV
jgi:hypothetical protein